MRSLLFELLVANPRLLELLVKTIDASRFATDTLIRRPQLLEEVTRSGTLDGNRTVARQLSALRKCDATIGKLDPIRAYRQAQSLRITIRDVLGLVDERHLEAEHTALAEACLIFMHSLLAADSDLTVIALGKFGGSELSYGADLDVIFVGENTRATQELLVEMGRPTAAGAIATLDPRLRPDGEKGVLTASLATCEAYYRTRAQLWEIQALTRARPICGPLGEQFIVLAQTVWRDAGKRDDLFVQIDAMRERIRRDRGSGAEILDYKTGLGGIVEAEFLVQALQMRAGLWNPSFAGALTALKENAVLREDEADTLGRSYDFLRRCDSVLRRTDNKGVATLPRDEGSQRVLAQRLGATNLSAFGDEYRASRETIHATYVRRFREAS